MYVLAKRAIGLLQYLCGLIEVRYYLWWYGIPRHAAVAHTEAASEAVSPCGRNGAACKRGVPWHA